MPQPLLTKRVNRVRRAWRFLLGITRSHVRRSHDAEKGIMRYRGLRQPRTEFVQYAPPAFVQQANTGGGLVVILRIHIPAGRYVHANLERGLPLHQLRPPIESVLLALLHFNFPQHLTQRHVHHSRIAVLVNMNLCLRPLHQIGCAHRAQISLAPLLR